ncbi:Peptidase family C54 [Rhizoctonia solani]|uniref:Cysteine protease n=1 Tax=Rhizoctonia solani TaxID=456999 RepID=A0A8H7M9H8_9AGAM|nr:Peptidase family C54 [Rhizoctonia solani]
MPPQMPTSPSSQKLHRMIRRQENQPGPEGSSRSRRGARRSSPSVGDSGSGSGPSIAVAEEGAADAELSRSPSSVSQAMAMAVATRARQSESAVVPSPSSTSVRLGDLSTRLSGWFSHLTGSTTDLGMTNSLSNAATMVPASPKRAQPRTDGPMSNVARPVKGGIDKVMRYLTDSDATPDGCTDPIWILGVLHAGFEPPDPSASPRHSQHLPIDATRPRAVSMPSSTAGPAIPPAPLPTTRTRLSSPSPPSPSSPAAQASTPTHGHPCSTKTSPHSSGSHTAPTTHPSATHPSSPSPPSVPATWKWPPHTSSQPAPVAGTGQDQPTSPGHQTPAGAACSALARACSPTPSSTFISGEVHWRRPHYPMFAEEHAVYVKILTWFFDTPSPLAPFGVHRMALAGKALGKDVGTWFGPSTAAGSIKTLAHAFPECQLSVSLAVDGTVFASDVYAASHMGMVTTSGRSISSRRSASKWGGRAVLILVNIRLGLDNVNPIYYDALKSLFQFPQSVGISGGRPSSSYYFVGSQADSLFYLDPHHTRPYIPLRPPPSVAPEPSDTEDSIPEETSDVPATPNAKLQPRRDITPDPHPTPRPRVSSPASPASSDVGHHRARSSFSPPRSMPNYQLPSASSSSKLAPLIPAGLIRQTESITAMPMSALDPSMLLGFLCRDDADWKDFRTRVADVSLRETVAGGFANLWQMSKKTKTLFSIADEPPSWSDIDSDDMGLESVSEPDMDSVPDHDDAEDFYDTHTGETRSAILGRAETSPPGELSTTDESMEVVTPGPRHSARFDTMRPTKDKLTHHSRAASSEGGDDDWVDPAPPPSDVSQIPGVENGAPASISATPSPDLVPSPSVPSVVSEGSSLPESPVRRGGKFPFPAGDDDEEELIMQYPKAQSTRGSTQLRTVRARDGGRTKSGGVRGWLRRTRHSPESQSRGRV